MKIVITDAQTLTSGDLDLTVFSDFGETIIYDTTDYSQIPERIKDADIIICNKTPFDKDNLKCAEKLKYIGLFATGYNNIDINYCKKNGITVCNAGSYSTDAVAQHVFAFILNYYSKVALYNDFVAKDGWKKSKTFSPFVYPTDELCGKTIGIIGYGSIGRTVAKIAKAFNMNILVYTRTTKTDLDVHFVSFDTLLEKSDIITLHCPLNEETNKLFNSNTFNKCKSGAYFINTARGPIVDETALAEALRNDKLCGAAIDVLEYEPMREDCVLYKIPNLTITPHVAWAPQPTRQRLVDIVYNNIDAYIKGEPRNVVSK